MALSRAEQDQVDQHVATNGVKRGAVDPSREPKRLANPFWRKRYKTASTARARVLATDLSRRHDAPPVELEK